MSKEDLEHRASAASAILGSPLVQEFFIQMERDLVAAMKVTDPRDKEGLFEIHRLLRTLEKFRQMFETAIRDGTFQQYKPKSAARRWADKVFP